MCCGFGNGQTLLRCSMNKQWFVAGQNVHRTMRAFIPVARKPTGDLGCRLEPARKTTSFDHRPKNLLDHAANDLIKPGTAPTTRSRWHMISIVQAQNQPVVKAPTESVTSRYNFCVPNGVHSVSSFWHTCGQSKRESASKTANLALAIILNIDVASRSRSRRIVTSLLRYIPEASICRICFGVARADRWPIVAAGKTKASPPAAWPFSEARSAWAGLPSCASANEGYIVCDSATDVEQQVI